MAVPDLGTHVSGRYVKTTGRAGWTPGLYLRNNQNSTDSSRLIRMLVMIGK